MAYAPPVEYQAPIAYAPPVVAPYYPTVVPYVGVAIGPRVGVYGYGYGSRAYVGGPVVRGYAPRGYAPAVRPYGYGYTGRGYVGGGFAARGGMAFRGGGRSR